LQVTGLLVHEQLARQVFALEFVTSVESLILFVLYSVSFSPVQVSLKVWEHVLGEQSEFSSHWAPHAWEQPLQAPDEHENGLHVDWLIQTLNKHWPDWQVYCFLALLHWSLHVNGSVWQIWPSFMFWHIWVVLVTVYVQLLGAQEYWRNSRAMHCLQS